MSFVSPFQQRPRRSMLQAKSRPSLCRRPLTRRSKSDDSGGGSMRHLIDYSTTRATHDAKDANRSQCRGPVMTCQLYDPTNNSRKKNMSARDVDWNVLSSTLDLSNEHDGRRENTEQSKTKTVRPDLLRRSCSARLRVNLAKSTSFRPSVVPEGEEKSDDNDIASDAVFWGDEEPKTAVKNITDGRPKYDRSMSLGAQSLMFRRTPISFNAKFA